MEATYFWVDELILYLTETIRIMAPHPDRYVKELIINLIKINLKQQFFKEWDP